MIDVRRVVTLGVLVMAGAVGPAPAVAQRATPTAVTGARAFAVEALGGTVGSALGIGIGLALAKPDNCPSNEDIACILRRLGAVGVIGVAGATVGTVIAGHWAGSDPSIVGALLGAAVGAATGIGLEHLITEEINQSLSDAGAVVLFSVTQGILAAAGSPIGAALR